MTISSGYYLKARIIADKPIAHASPHIREVWDYILREANYKDNRYGNFMVKRGQLFRSYKDIREALHWKIGWRKEMYSENQMKTTMRYLKKALMITTKKALGGVLITVINYDTYQNPKNYESTNENTNESTCCAPMKTLSSSDNNNKDKELKKVKNKNITPVEKNSTPRRVIELLNQTCGKNFNTQTEAHRKAINARLSEGHTFEDFKTVIEFKNQDWTKDAVFTHQDGKTKKVRDYLQPSTLFSSKNFDKYLNEASSSGFVKSSNLKSKEEVLALLKTALKEKTEADTFRVIKELDPEIYAIVQSKCQMFFVNRESDFRVIYRNYIGK
jgi:uncharacterized phage protein (TIGR02220 family)